MRPLATVAVCGLVPVPPMADTQACRDEDNQPPTADDENAARLAWHRHDAAERMARMTSLRASARNSKTCAPSCGPWRSPTSGRVRRAIHRLVQRRFEALGLSG